VWRSRIKCVLGGATAHVGIKWKENKKWKIPNAKGSGGRKGEKEGRNERKR
jgi:hypothetical protein